MVPASAFISSFGEVRFNRGFEVDVQQVRKWFEEDGVKYAYNAALRYLGFRSRSRKEIEDYLKRKGFEDNTIRVVMEKLERYGLADDKAFARDWVRNRMHTGAREQGGNSL